MIEVGRGTLETPKKCGQGTLSTQLFKRGYHMQPPSPAPKVG